MLHVKLIRLNLICAHSEVTCTSKTGSKAEHWQRSNYLKSCYHVGHLPVQEHGRMKTCSKVLCWEEGHQAAPVVPAAPLAMRGVFDACSVLPWHCRSVAKDQDAEGTGPQTECLLLSSDHPLWLRLLWIRLKSLIYVRIGVFCTFCVRPCDLLGQVLFLPCRRSKETGESNLGFEWSE